MSLSRHPFILKYDEVFHPEYPLATNASWRTLETSALIRLVRNAFSPFYDEVRKEFQNELVAYQALVAQQTKAPKVEPQEKTAVDIVLRFIRRVPINTPPPPPLPPAPLCPTYDTVFGEIVKDACGFVEELESLMREYSAKNLRNEIDLAQFARRMKEVERELKTKHG